MIDVIDINDVNSMFPEFGLVKSIFINNIQEPFFICQLIATLNFENHFEDHRVDIPQKLM